MVRLLVARKTGLGTPEMADIFPHLDYKPKLPQRLDHGIGIVGAGGIVNYAHLFAHKKIGFRVVGIT